MRPILTEQKAREAERERWAAESPPSEEALAAARAVLAAPEGWSGYALRRAAFLTTTT